MRLEQLTGRYFRLQQELSLATQQHPWRQGMIDRLRDELAATQREIEDRSTSDDSPGGLTLDTP